MENQVPELPLNEEVKTSNSVSDIEEFLKGDTDAVVEPKKEVKKESKKKEDEEVEIDTPPRKQQILKDYPDLFKKYPFLEKVLYRDKEYRELFGSFDDAKEIAEKADIFKSFESQLLSGNTTEILKNVKETEPKAFDKIVDTYLTSLASVDKDAYFEVISNISKQLIKEMSKEGDKSNNDQLKEAALIVNQFLFGSDEYTEPKTRTDLKKSDEQSEVEKERLSFVQERFESSRDEIQSKVDNILKSTIAEYIDPKGVMSSYVKKNAIADALNDVHKVIGDDDSVRKSLDRFWRVAFDSKFSKDSLAKIQSFYLGRAKMNLPNSIKRAIAEALKDFQLHRPEKDDEKEEETPIKKGLVDAGRPSQQRKQKMEKGETVAEFFARD